MADRLQSIIDGVEIVEDVVIVNPFSEEPSVIKGRVAVNNTALTSSLEFDVFIYSAYPFKANDFDTIKFINKDLLKYNHVMGDGSICLHTKHDPEIGRKLGYDFQGLKSWIQKYVVEEKSDTHYEHIVKHQNLFNGGYYSYFFASVDYTFTKGQYGYVSYSSMSFGGYRQEKINSSIIQSFRSNEKRVLVDISWNVKLKSLPTSIGAFIFIEDIPADFGRLAYDSWQQLGRFINQEFLEFLHLMEKQYHKKKGQYMPLFIGYKISDQEIHWESILLELGKFPIYGNKINGKFVTMLDEDRQIEWGLTRNCSYKYLFGRGTLEPKLVKGKVLIIGVGAIGSILAKSLARCGCMNISLIDYDIKEPENVCRSEFRFDTGITNKITELTDDLLSISPFIEVSLNYDFTDAFNYYIKSKCSDVKRRLEITNFLNSYELIFDCTADNDLLFILSQLNITSHLINMSISNHAKSLVCASENNRYEFIQNQFDNILEYDVDDLFNPTGCWNPTFRASYNDINVLVQYAIKHLNLRLSENRMRNFVLDSSCVNGFHIELKEF